MEYKDIKFKVDQYNNSLLEKVEATEKLSDIQEFNTKVKKVKVEYQNSSLVDIYKQEYKKVSKNTEEHIQRGVNDIGTVFENLGLGTDYIELAKISHELHDIARRPQFIETSTVVDYDSYDREILKSRNIKLNLPEEVINHATHGEYLLRSYLFELFDINKEYRKIIATAVKHHSDNRLSKFLTTEVSEDLFEGNSLDKTINELKYEDDLVRLYTQTVKCVDNFDLMNKVLLGNIPLIRECFSLDVLENNTIKYFADFWGVDENILREYNKLPKNKELTNGEIISIPTKEVPIEKFQIPEEYINMLKTDTFPERLKDLQSRKDYTFLTAQVWRLSLLRNVDFKSLLQVVDDTKMLDKILDLYPEKFKEIMRPSFEYTKEYIVKKGLDNPKSKIYTLSRSQNML